MLAAVLLAALLQYSSPVNYPISLAGNFAEPRPNHFHGGTDVKTKQRVGIPLFSIADGYVSAVSIGVGGYGNAVYVHHPDGTTSQYCHLKAFAPQIFAAARSRDGKVELERSRTKPTYVGTIRFRPTELPVSRGQFIAVSGNSGSSQAPHLHLEIHDTRTWDMFDPLDFIGDNVDDTIPPLAHGFMAYPQQYSGVFNGGYNKQTFAFNAHHLNRHFSAWGRVGFAIWANDYSETTYNRLGIRRTELYVDDVLQFASDTRRIPASGNMQVNAWGDYEHYLRYHVWYMRSFLLPGVTLPIFQTNGDRGVVTFNEQRDYHVRYVLSDYKGNTATYTFTVQGVPMPMQSPRVHRRGAAKFMLRAIQPNAVQLPGMTLTTVSHCAAEDIVLMPSVKRQPDRLSDAYRLAERSTPMFHYGKLSIRLNKHVDDPSQLCLVRKGMEDREINVTYKDGWVSGLVRELGAEYEVKYKKIKKK